MTGESTMGPSAAWRARVSALAGVVAGLFVMALYARQQPGVISDWDPTWVATTALPARRESIRRHPGSAVAELAAVPAPRPLGHRSVHLHSPATGAGHLRRPGNRGVHLRRHAPPPLDPVLPDQRCHALELDGGAMGAALDRRGADPCPLVAPAGQAHRRIRAVDRMADQEGGDRWTGSGWAQSGGSPDVDTGVAGLRLEDAARTPPAPAGGLSVVAGSTQVAASGGTTARGARRHTRRRPRSTRPCHWRCCAGIDRRPPASPRLPWWPICSSCSARKAPGRWARNTSGGCCWPSCTAQPSRWFCGGPTSDRRTIGPGPPLQRRPRCDRSPEGEPL